jgi:hypothetical protein
MAENVYLNHEERTASEPRRSNVHTVSPISIEQVNDSVKVIRLAIEDAERGIEVSTSLKGDGRRC